LYIYIFNYIYNIMIHYIVSLGPFLQLMKLEGGEGYHGPPFFTPIRGCGAGPRWHSHPETENLVRTPGVGDWTGPGGKMWKKTVLLGGLLSKNTTLGPDVCLKNLNF
jgi:hypothetical protein